jgi:hypothetical protein
MCTSRIKLKNGGLKSACDFSNPGLAKKDQDHQNNPCDEKEEEKWGCAGQDGGKKRLRGCSGRWRSNQKLGRVGIGQFFASCL